MRTTTASALVLLLLATGASPAAAQTFNDASITVEPVITTDLGLPTTMVFLGADDFLICEKNTGQVKRVQSGAMTGVVLNLNVNNGSERGLLGIALHPDFASNNFVYLYYSRTSSTTMDTSTSATWTSNRVSRFTWTGSAINAASEVTIVDFPRDAAQQNGPNHDGGIIRFGPDGKLYGVTGDLNRGRFSNPRIEQNTSTTDAADVGGIFRLNDDGTIPADNPFESHSLPAIQRLYCYGVRNSFGMSFDNWSTDYALWMTENGPTIFDEVNRAFRGWNSGWLRIMGPDSRNATYGENNNTAYDADDLTVLAGSAYSDPEFSFRSPNGIAAIRALNSVKLPCHLRGKFLVGENNFGEIYLFTPNAARDAFELSGGVADLVADSIAERQSVRIGTGWSVTTDIHIGPDGYVYLVELGLQAVYRLRPTDPSSVCEADYNADCAFDAFDYDDFVSDFFNGFPRADYNVDGVVDAFDYDDFVNDFFIGC